MRSLIVLSWRVKESCFQKAGKGQSHDSSLDNLHLCARDAREGIWAGSFLHPQSLEEAGHLKGVFNVLNLRADYSNGCVMKRLHLCHKNQ